MDIEDEIRRLLPTGLSFQQIGKQLGMTRNAIAGRVSRMRTRGDLDNKYNVLVSRVTTSRPASAARPKFKLEVKPDESIGGVHLLDLREDDCRYPIGETARGHFFCGEPRRDHKTRYCAEHHPIVWVKRSAPNDRKADRNRR
jgi:GcrA cell cycle regulator